MAGVTQSIAELLRLNVPTAMKLAFDNLKSSTFKTRDEAITDVGGFDSIELSVMLCNDEFIRKLNKEWRDEDHATDVLSMSQHVPGLDLPFVSEKCLVSVMFTGFIYSVKLASSLSVFFFSLQLMLGDVVISVETAARQAEERGHTIIDEIRVLLVGTNFTSVFIWMFWYLVLAVMIFIHKLDVCACCIRVVG